MAKQYILAVSADRDGFKNVAHVYDADDFRLAPDYKFSNFNYRCGGEWNKKAKSISENGRAVTIFKTNDGRTFQVFSDRSALEIK